MSETSRTVATGQAGDAIVLCRAATGLATVRALEEAGVRVHALMLDAQDPLRWSRHARKVDVSALAQDEAGLLAALREVALSIGGRPVVIPTSDALALMLARHRDSLSAVCRLWTTDLAVMEAIVCKEQLYRAAQAAGVATIPCLSNATMEEVVAWSEQHPGPYFLKPSYEAVAQSSVRGKNFTVQTREQLLAFVAERGLKNAVVQRFIEGGDGEIFDSYGLCDRKGRVVVMASHRRLRQYPPHTGVTCYGAIPAGLPDDEVLFAPTRQLMAQWRYHGVFGIEWLRDKRTGTFYVVDFNARPFLSIGHLCDCGLNLPWLAWRELQGDPLADVAPTPALRSSLWMDALRDIATWRRSGHGSVLAWLALWLRTPHHAYWRASDPGPAYRQVFTFAAVVVGVAGRRLKRALPESWRTVPPLPTRRLEDRRPPLL